MPFGQLNLQRARPIKITATPGHAPAIPSEVILAILPMYEKGKKGTKRQKQKYWERTIEDKFHEIFTFARKEGFALYRQAGQINNDEDDTHRYCSPLRLVRWEYWPLWKEFFNLARRQGVTMIIVRSRGFTTRDWRALRLFEDRTIAERIGNVATKGGKLGFQQENKPWTFYPASALSAEDRKHPLVTLSENIGHTVYYSFQWIVNGCIFTLSEVEQWFKPIIPYFRGLEKAYDHVDSIDTVHQLLKENAAILSTSLSTTEAAHNNYESYLQPWWDCSRVQCRENNGEPKANEIEKEVTKTTREILVQECIEFVRKRTSDQRYGMLTTAYLSEMFWHAKGLDKESLSLPVRTVLTNIEKEAFNVLRNMTRKRDKEDDNAHLHRF